MNVKKAASLVLLIIVALGVGTVIIKSMAKDRTPTSAENIQPSALQQPANTNVSSEQSAPADSAQYQTVANPEAQNQSESMVTFVELGSVNCIPCKMMQPIMKEIEEEYKDQVKVVFHDVWTENGRPYAMKYRIRVIPTQVFLDKDGREYYRHEGFFPKDELVGVLKMQGVK